jgi:LSD1 subclass zinc finger protein
MADGDSKLHCSGCGADLEYSAGDRALKCVYCGAVTEIPHSGDDAIDDHPQQVVALTVDRPKLEDAVFQHLAEGKYTPDDLLEYAAFTKFEQFFVPAYAFTGTYEAQWTASFGYDRTEHYTDFVSDGKGNSRPVTRTRTVTDWRPVNGTDTGKFSVLTYGGSRLAESPLGLPVRLVEGCRLSGDVAEYSPSFTSGFEIEAFSVAPNDAYSARGKDQVNAIVDAGVKQHAQGDRQRDWHWTGTTQKKTSRVLIPVCHVVYEYKGGTYNVWTDGTSTANLVADTTPVDDSRKRAVQLGFIPAGVAALGFAIGAISSPISIGDMPESALMWIGVGAALLYGAMRRHAVLSYSMKLRQAILAQRKLDTSNAANLDEATRQKMVEACKRPDRLWFGNTAKDSVILPVASLVVLAAVLVPRLHEAVADHYENQSVEASSNVAPESATLASVSPPAAQPAQPEQPAAPAAQPQQQDAATAASDAAQTAGEPANADGQAAAGNASRLTVAQPVLAVLQAAARNDWNAVDSNTGDMARNAPAATAHGDRASARAANADGMSALQAKNYPGAVDAFLRGVASDPSDIELANNLGYAYEESGQQQPAIDTLDAVLTRAPRRAAAWANMSSSFADAGQIDAAKIALAIAVHFSGDRDHTLAYLQQQSTNGRTDAIRQVSLAVSQLAANIPPVSDAPPATAGVTGGQQVMTSAQNVGLRECAGVKCAALLIIPKGTQLTIDPTSIKVVTDPSGEQTPWVKISYDGIYCAVGTTCRHMVKAQMATDGWLDVKSLVPAAQ